MKRILLFSIMITTAFTTPAQTTDRKISKAVQKVYSEYKLFFDSSLLGKYVVLDKTKSYLVNSRTQKLRSIDKSDDTFVFDEFSLMFAFVYKGDTIRHFPPCRLDTFQNMMALGTPSNPIRHGDVLPPYLELAKGNIKFDYKKLKGLLQKMDLGSTETDLQSFLSSNEGKKEYMWVVTITCPDKKCRQLQISANDGKVLGDIKP